MYENQDQLFRHNQVWGNIDKCIVQISAQALAKEFYQNNTEDKILYGFC